MFFRIKDPFSRWSIQTPGGSLATVTKDDAGFHVEGSLYANLEDILAMHPGSTIKRIPEPEDATLLLTVGDDEYKLQRQGTGYKFWGKSVRVSHFDTFDDLARHLGEFFFKSIEAFEHPEYICTDSKGAYVATIVADGERWRVYTKDPDGGDFYDDLDAAMTGILRSTTI